MTISQIVALKAKIKEKFGSLSRFAQLIGYEVDDKGYSSFTKEFKAIEYRFKKGTCTKEDNRWLANIGMKVEKTKTSISTSKEISFAELVRIKTAIEQIGGVMHFCEVNPDFKASSIYELINGGRDVKSKMVISLMKKLELL